MTMRPDKKACTNRHGTHDANRGSHTGQVINRDTEKDEFARKCYGIYKLRWLADHGITLEELLSNIDSFIQEDVLDKLPEWDAHEYIKHTQPKITEPAKVWESLNIYGENGKYLKSFGEKGFYESFYLFLTTIFTNRERMESLLDPGLFETWESFQKT